MTPTASQVADILDGRHTQLACFSAHAFLRERSRLGIPSLADIAVDAFEQLMMNLTERDHHVAWTAGDVVDVGDNPTPVRMVQHLRRLGIEAVRTLNAHERASLGQRISVLPGGVR